jgi:hypothetical protein
VLRQIKRPRNLGFEAFFHALCLVCDANAVNPIQAFGDGEFGGIGMIGKVIVEAHHTVCACTAAATGDRDLSRESAAGQRARASSNLVFAQNDGVVLNVKSRGHEYLKK